MVSDRTIITQSPQETARVGEELGNRLRKKVNGKREKGRGGAVVICLYGELGSGKTTFAQGFARGLGITSRLLSPTFIIVRRYQLPKTIGFLYHIDLYRVTEKDLTGLGLSEIFSDCNSYVLIEWAEKLGNCMPKERIDVRFKTLEDGRHVLTISGK